MGLKIPDLDNKTFAEIVAEARQLISRYSPQWTDHNLHDPGITFIDLFAYLADMQIYRLNCLTGSHYRKFLKLTDASPAPARPARVHVIFENIPTAGKQQEENQNEVIVPQGTQIYTTIGTECINFKTEKSFILSAGSPGIAPNSDNTLFNKVSALQIEEVKNENPGKGNGLPGQVLTLKKNPVIKDSLLVEVQMAEKQEDNDAGGIREKWQEWEMVEDFEFSGPDDLHYVFNPGAGEITFGNGLNGLIPTAGKSIRATYETTLGVKGNIPKGQTFHIKLPGFSGITGKNPENAGGGRDEETIEDAKIRARKDLRTPYRAVTSSDYEELARRTPGLRVARAKAVVDHKPGIVTVVVMPEAKKGVINPQPGEEFLQILCKHLDKSRLITTGLKVVGPDYVEISIKCKIRIKKKSSQDEVTNQVEAALTEFLDPLRWPFGRQVFPSEVYQLLDNVAGVDYASALSISARGHFSPYALVFSGTHQLQII